MVALSLDSSNFSRNMRTINQQTGCRVELVKMFEEPRKDMVPELTGEVMFVDDAGDIHVAWSNGSTLAAIHGIDVIRRND